MTIKREQREEQLYTKHVQDIVYGVVTQHAL